MSYDRADWHHGGDYPPDLPPENGGTHIGMFLAWAINTNLENDLHREYAETSLNAVRNREMTGREFFEVECDEKFSDGDLNDEGNAFAIYYYESNLYITDYEEALAKDLPSLYHIENTWDNYDKIAKLIDQRYEQWRNQEKEPQMIEHQKIKTKNWWQFWK